METKKYLKFILPYIGKYKMDYTILTFFVIVGMLLNLGSAKYFQVLVNGLMDQDSINLVNYLLLGILIILMMMFVNYINTYYITRTTSMVKCDMRQEMFNHILHFPVRYYDSTHSGELQSRIQQDTEQLDGVLGHNMIQFIVLPLSGLLSFIYLSFIHLPLAIITLLLGPLVILVSKLFGITIRNNGMQVQSNVAKLTEQLQETISNHTVIKIFKLENMMFKKYRDKNKDLLRLQLKDGVLSGGLQALSIGISYCSQILIFAIGSFFVANQHLTIGDLLAFIVLSQSLILPFSNIGQLWSNLQRSLAAVARMQELMRLPKYEELTHKHVKQVPVDIVFKNVSFSYDDEKTALQSVNLEIKAGDRVAILGKNGSGKSTLMKLLLGLYSPTEGEIWLHPKGQDGFILKGVNPYTSYVPQDQNLFDDTIYLNIKYGEMGATEEKVYQAADLAYAHSFIQELPGTYEFRVGECGSKLSGGQRQRIMLARAIIGDHSVMVMDEATSALDLTSENVIMNTLKKLKHQPTVILITHHVASVTDFEKIMFLEDGKLLAVGTHDELLQTNEKYQRFFHQNEVGKVQK